MTTTNSRSSWLVATIVGAIVLMASIVLVVMFRDHMVNVATQKNSTTNTQSTHANAEVYAANNAIQAQAIKEKDPALCAQITGPTSVSFPLPTPDNGVQTSTRTFDMAESITRCQTQAKAGSAFVY